MIIGMLACDLSCSGSSRLTCQHLMILMGFIHTVTVSFTPILTRPPERESVPQSANTWSTPVTHSGTGELTDDTLHVPGEDRLWRNGDVGPDGEPGFVQILVASTSVDPDIAGFTQFQEICRNLPSTQYGEVSHRYIPQHGDCVIVMFAPMGYFPSGSGLSQTDAGSDGVSDTDTKDVAAYVPSLIASP